MVHDNKEKYINPYTDFGFKEKIFTKLFEQAEIARFSPEERRGYEDSVKAYRDINNAINTAKAEAKVEANTESARKNESKRICD